MTPPPVPGTTPAVSEPDAQSVGYLAAVIRKVDGNHDLGAADLAAAILRELPGLADRTSINPDDVTVNKNKYPDPAKWYPKTDSYTWGEFAGAAIELGGYSDISWVDPYNGDRVHLSGVFYDNPDGSQVSLTDAVRRLCDAVDHAMERGDFGKQDEQPKSKPQSTTV